MPARRPPYQYPYTPTPGSSMPPAPTTPAQGQSDLWGYFWLALLNTFVIAVVGITTWLYVHHAF